ncbi:Ribosomal silencing factor rsfs [Thalictrum thalictroides]|uniref:Ribosomal silencing factor rsfs n=1 Tax=Thalictrum thalictroides TaxID=46969 RepID=A0A7J6VXY3_THATH|nr:Ribosomal silencing factor rsfs [Thalictrum thalictroides]
MLTALRTRALPSLSSSSILQTWKLGFQRSLCSSTENLGYLDLQEVEKILKDVKADDVKVIPVGHQCDWTDFMVIATGRSTWHVRNIAEALIYKVKQKQKGAERMLLPSVQGHEGGKWVVVDSGRVIVHALDEKAREYYNLESLWMSDLTAKRAPNKDLEKSLVKVRPKNNSKKKPVQKNV